MSGASGNAFVEVDDSNAYLWTWAQVWKTTEQLRCAELWHNIDLTEHHAPDVFVNCGTGWHTIGGYWMPRSTSGGPAGTAHYSQIEAPPHKGTIICLVDPLTKVRVRNQNCFGDAHPELMQYSLKSYAQMKSTGSDGPGTWDIPGLIKGRINLREVTGNNLERGTALVSWNSQYIATFQMDGNFVVYRLTNGYYEPIWSTGTNGNWNAYMRFQGDGNFVIYNPGEDCIWHSGTYNQSITHFEMRDNGLFQGRRANGSYVGLGSYGC
jgi:hypothetical protein